ncbi:hypothetical protein C9J03_22740 [Photobacterium gaetbulicola]|uniref:Uncharacterized protein n=2 Tax=Photobacterium gaetbulicola TaxID=1295392 RepID=A0A0C5WUZ1_9GAMM|nr:hypothetical protein H744_2c0113 [Photobacterium gaetbulicola Gung47]PSU02842.1 hypothetical protein C9J03_22740 [Photobacterium gaetbulicola]
MHKYGKAFLDEKTTYPKLTKKSFCEREQITLGTLNKSIKYYLSPVDTKVIEESRVKDKVIKTLKERISSLQAELESTQQAKVLVEGQLDIMVTELVNRLPHR